MTQELGQAAEKAMKDYAKAHQMISLLKDDAELPEAVLALDPLMAILYLEEPLKAAIAACEEGLLKVALERALQAQAAFLALH